MINLSTLKSECSNFLNEIESSLLIKSLPCQEHPIKKIKVRKKHKSNIISDALNSSFPEYKNLIQRSVFSSNEIKQPLPNEELFYVFPINGFKFIYNPVIKNTYNDYEKSLYSLIQNLPLNSTLNIFSEMIKLGYLSKDLKMGINSGAEIIIYGIPYYYAVKKSFLDSDDKFLTKK